MRWTKWRPGPKAKRRAAVAAAIAAPLLLAAWIAWATTGLDVDTPVDLPGAWHGVTTGLNDPEVVSLTADGHVLHHGAPVTLDELADALLERKGHPLLVCADEDALAGHLLYLLEVGKRTDPERHLYLAVRCLGRKEALPVTDSRPYRDAIVVVYPDEVDEGAFWSEWGWAPDRSVLRAAMVRALEKEEWNGSPYPDLASWVREWGTIGTAFTARCERYAEAVDVLFGLGGGPVGTGVVRAQPAVRARRRLRTWPPSTDRAWNDGSYLAPMDLPLVRHGVANAQLRPPPYRWLLMLEPRPWAFRINWTWRYPPDPTPPEDERARLAALCEEYRQVRREEPVWEQYVLLYSRHLPWRRYAEAVAVLRDTGWFNALVAVRVAEEVVPGARQSDYDPLPTDGVWHVLPVEWGETPDPVLRVEVRDGPRVRVGGQEVTDLGALRTLLSTLSDPGPAGLYAPADLEAQGVVEVLCELVAADLRVVGLGLLDEDH